MLLLERVTIWIRIWKDNLCTFLRFIKAGEYSGKKKQIAIVNLTLYYVLNKYLSIHTVKFAGTLLRVNLFCTIRQKSKEVIRNFVLYFHFYHRRVCLNVIWPIVLPIRWLLLGATKRPNDLCLEDTLVSIKKKWFSVFSRLPAQYSVTCVTKNAISSFLKIRCHFSE